MLRKKVRLVHTSDLHLGDPQTHPWADAGLASVIEAVPRVDADVLLMVGDIFDNDRVLNDILESFVHQVSRLSVPVVVLPGNHDHHGKGSVYLREPFRFTSRNLRIINNPEGQTIHFPDMDLDIWGRAIEDHTPDFKPLAGMPQATPGRWLVALAHGHFQEEGDDDRRSSPIAAGEVARATCDYLALGHWDRSFDVSQGNVAAAYSGAPFGPSGNTSGGSVNLVDLDPQEGVRVKQVRLDRPDPMP